MAVVLPTPTDLARYRFRISLSGVVFSFRLYFNRRDQHWFADIADNAGVELRSGVKLVADFPILRTWVQQGRPVGDLLVLDPSSDVDPLLGELGLRSLLVYDDGT